MRNLLIFALVFAFGKMFSQYRFVYRIDFKIDSLNREFIQSENFNLDVNEDSSIFYPQVFAKLDSIYDSKGSINRKKIPETKLDYIVKKNYKNGGIYFREMIGMVMYEVQEPRKIIWKQSNETTKYDRYKVKKATTEFAGRKWEAWFTDEFGVNDGPYKFNGLPGMILKIKDTRSDYDIYLVEVKKIAKPLTLDFFKKLNIKSMAVEHQTYLKKKKEFTENPAVMFIEMGLELPAEEMKQFNETRKSIEAKQNNKIELTY